MLRRQQIGILTIILVPFILASCATSSTQEMIKAKKAYVAQDYNLSFQHVNRAAQAGDPDAQYALGYMYYYGRGVPQSYQQGKYWIDKAAAQGQPLAIQAQKMLVNPDKAVVAPTPKRPVKVYGSRVSSKKAVTHRYKLPKAVRAMPSSKHNSRSERALLAVPSSHYTIQLLGSSHKSGLLSFRRQHNLSGTHIYHTYHNGKGWYVLVKGNYRSISLAKLALRRLPKSERFAGAWVKSFRIVKREIRTKA